MSRLLMNRLTVHKDLRQSIPQPLQRRQPGSFSLPVNIKRYKLIELDVQLQEKCIVLVRLVLQIPIAFINKGWFSVTSLIVCSLRPLYFGSQQAWTSCTVNIVWKRWLLICRLGICRDRRSCEIFVSCVNFPRKKRSLQVSRQLNVNFLHNC